MSEDRKPIPFVTYDPNGRIDMDLQGLKYGYNLRTLRDDGECPECGANIYRVSPARLAISMRSGLAAKNGGGNDLAPDSDDLFRSDSGAAPVGADGVASSRQRGWP